MHALPAAWYLQSKRYESVKEIPRDGAHWKKETCDGAQISYMFYAGQRVPIVRDYELTVFNCDSIADLKRHKAEIKRGLAGGPIKHGTEPLLGNMHAIMIAQSSETISSSESTKPSSLGLIDTDIDGAELQLLAIDGRGPGKKNMVMRSGSCM